MSKTSQNLQAYAVMTIAAWCWAANSIFSRLAANEVSPMLLVTFRWFGVLLLILVFARRYIAQDWPVLRIHLRYVAIMGACGFTGFNALFYVAGHTTTAINLGILQGAMPVFVILGMFVAYRARVTRMQVFGVILTIGGEVVVGSAGSLDRLSALKFNTGDILVMGCCLLYAGYAVGLRNRPDVSALGFFSAMATAAFFTSLPLSMLEWALGDLQWPTTKGWMIIPAVVLLPSFLAQVCFLRGVALIGPNRAGVFINLVPIFVAILAVLFIRENFELFHAIGLFFVMGGIWLSERGKDD